MIDHYKILGVKKTATKDEIKKAYKKLALKYHPDMGGDSVKFLEISESYQILIDDVKRSEFDNSYVRSSDTMYDAFGNKISINIEISLTFTLEQLQKGWSCPNFEYQTNTGIDYINIELSYTIMSGTVLRYLGKGNFNNGVRGDLYLKIIIQDGKFKKKSLKDIVTVLEVDYIRATVGGIVKIDNFIRKETLVFKIPSNVKEGSMVKSSVNLGMGLDGDRGSVYGIVKLVYPTLNKVTKSSLKLIAEYIEKQEDETYFNFK